MTDVVLSNHRPTHAPTPGLYLPCTVHRLRDADTIEIMIVGSLRIWPIRLLHCWAPEKYTPEGKAATARAEQLLRDAKDLSVFVPAPEDPLRVLEGVTFDRVLGWIYLDGHRTLNDQLVIDGHATRTKEAK